MSSSGADDLLGLARSVRDRARSDEELEVVLGRSRSTLVKVHDGRIESVTTAGTSGAGIRVIRDGRQGFAHCGSLEPEVLAETLAEARDNCAFSQPDEFSLDPPIRFGEGSVLG